MSLGSAVCGGEASDRRALQVCSEPSPEGWPGTVAIPGTEVEGKGGSRSWPLLESPHPANTQALLSHGEPPGAGKPSHAPRLSGCISSCPRTVTVRHISTT